MARTSPPFTSAPEELAAPYVWQTSRYRIDLTRPRVMGIVNVTPDSFYAASRSRDTAKAIAHCEQLLGEGADLLDIGGESTRPGAAALTDAEELARVLPVLDAALTMGCAVSIDTRKPAVMAEALRHGVDIVNDVQALQSPGALEIVASHPRCGVCLMHMRGQPSTMQRDTRYDDVVDEVGQFLSARLQALREAGIAEERVVLDPGIGFGKDAAQNLELLRRQCELLRIGRPLLVGWSRKSTLGRLTGREVDGRQAASVGAALAAIQLGARIVRVHDVAATVDALKVWVAAGLATG